MPASHSTILPAVQPATHQNKMISVQNPCAPHRCSGYLVVSHTGVTTGNSEQFQYFQFLRFCSLLGQRQCTYLQTPSVSQYHCAGVCDFICYKFTILASLVTIKNEIFPPKTCFPQSDCQDDSPHLTFQPKGDCYFTFCTHPMTSTSSAFSALSKSFCRKEF